MVYDELGMSDRGVDAWEHRAKAAPGNQEYAVQHFMSAIRTKQLKRAQLQAMAIYKNFGAALPESYFWAVMTLIGQAQQAQVSSAESVESDVVFVLTAAVGFHPSG